MQWCFAAVSTVAPMLQSVELIEIFDEDRAATKVLQEPKNWQPAGSASSSAASKVASGSPSPNSRLRTSR
jgi:hypothetical protein